MLQSAGSLLHHQNPVWIITGCGRRVVERRLLFSLTFLFFPFSYFSFACLYILGCCFFVAILSIFLFLFVLPLAIAVVCQQHTEEHWMHPWRLVCGLLPSFYIIVCRKKTTTRCRSLFLFFVFYFLFSNFHISLSLPPRDKKGQHSTETGTVRRF